MGRAQTRVAQALPLERFADALAIPQKSTSVGEQVLVIH
jgi:hypothetical protein